MRKRKAEHSEGRKTTEIWVSSAEKIRQILAECISKGSCPEAIFLSKLEAVEIPGTSTTLRNALQYMGLGLNEESKKGYNLIFQGISLQKREEGAYYFRQ